MFDKIGIWEWIYHIQTLPSISSERSQKTFALLRGETGKHISDKSISICEKHYGAFLCAHEEMQILDVFPDFHEDSRELVDKEQLTVRDKVDTITIMGRKDKQVNRMSCWAL